MTLWHWKRFTPFPFKQASRASSSPAGKPTPPSLVKKAPLGHKGPIPPIRGKWPEGPKGVGTLSAKLTEGMRTSQISEHSEF